MELLFGEPYGPVAVGRVPEDGEEALICETAGHPDALRRRGVYRPHARRDRNLVERVRSRVGAYVYGNILVLAAIIATSPESIADWTAVVYVVGTAATTFFGHVVAHRIGQSIGRSDDEALRLHLAQEARDAVPIVSSGTGPAVLLALGA